jgi:DnaK suppressor protein
MDREMVQRFKGLFEQQKRQLVFSQGLQVEQFSIGKDDMLDESDQSTSETETEMRMRLRNREALYLKKIDQSLRRIEEGTFGLCDSCGDDIDPRRLEARPTSCLCVSCKEDSERKEHAHIDGHKPKSLGRALRFA